MRSEGLVVTHAPSLYSVAQRFVGLAFTHDYLSCGRGHRQLRRAVTARTSTARLVEPPNSDRSSASMTLRVRSFSDAEQQYLAQVAAISRLSGAEEYQLAKRMKAGDTVARNLLIQANLGLVVMFARRHTRPGLPLLDLVAEGNLGLFSSADRFDPEMGFRFATYAKWGILHNIHSVVRRFNDAQGSAVDSHGTCLPASSALVASGLSSNSLEPTAVAPTAADNNHFDETAEADTSECEPPQVALRYQRHALLQRAMELLTERDRAIVNARFALNGEVEETLAVLARRHSLSIERVRQIERSALGKLATALQDFGATADNLF